MHDPARDPDLAHLEEEVERSRAGLSQSLNALTDSLSVKSVGTHLSAAAEGYGGEFGRKLWHMARDNPAALGLLGAGLAVLLTGAGGRTGTGHAAAPKAEPFPSPGAGPVPLAAMPPLPAPEPQRPTAARLNAALHYGLDRLPPQAREQVLKARKAAIAAQDAVEKQAARASRVSRDVMDSQPLAVGGIAFGAGALAAALLPGTRHEDRMLGDHRDALMAEADRAFRRELSRAAVKGEEALHAGLERGSASLRDALH